VNLPNFEKMSMDKLWALRAEVRVLLTAKITAEKQELERRLLRLKGDGTAQRDPRRPYPKVLPRYQNPANPTETWSGRGKQPKWVSAQLRSGKNLSDFAI
jgi:DNA-binding protein H-NS